MLAPWRVNIYIYNYIYTYSKVVSTHLWNTPQATFTNRLYISRDSSHFPRIFCALKFTFRIYTRSRHWLQVGAPGWVSLCHTSVEVDVTFVFQKTHGINVGDIYTLPETNIAPENGWLEYYFPIGMAYFQVLC